MKNIYEVLKELQIDYEEYEHDPVFTCEESEALLGHLSGAKDKNLFLRNKKGTNHYLVTIQSHKRADLKALAEIVGEKALSFASPERLKKYLGVMPGSVTPFGLIHDTNKEVSVIMDADLFEHEKIQFHPDRNSATLIVGADDMKRFLEWTGNTVRYVPL